MHEKKIQNLLKMTPQERFEFTVRHCADFEKIWGLVVGEDNWVIFKGKDGTEIFPVWPDAILADYCAFEEHKSLGAQPQAIAINSFLENCIPDMIKKNVMFGVFYDLRRESLCVSGSCLEENLREEIQAVWK